MSGARRSGASMSWTRALAAALLWLAVLSAGAAARAQTADAGPPFVLKQLAPGVWAAIDRGGRAGANAGFIIGDDGVAVVDSFYRPQAAPALLAEIRKLTPLPIRYVINTHYHIDHVAGDKVFTSAGALVVAQRNVRGWIHTENLKFFGPDPKPEQKALVAGLPSPEILVDHDLVLYLGSRRLELTSRPGHTGGDLVVAVPDAKVVFCGDLLWRRTSPNLIDALTPRYVGWDGFSGMAPREIPLMAAELAGTKRVPTPETPK